MALYAIGDIQGCYDPLQALLDRIEFDPVNDTVWFTGDLVNRGPKSLETLRFVKSLGTSAVTVLGNHDLHLLAAACGIVEPRGKDTITQIINAPDSAELLDWVRHLPLAHFDAARKLLMVHAGVHPLWDERATIKAAHEVEMVLRGDRPEAFFAEMYGNKPRRWHDSLTGVERLRCITNILTRMRYLERDHRLELKFKGSPGEQPEGLVPWFESTGRRPLESRIIFGHWSSLGLITEGPVVCLDSGCLWGRTLTALRLEPGPQAVFAIECQ